MYPTSPHYRQIGESLEIGGYMLLFFSAPVAWVWIMSLFPEAGAEPPAVPLWIGVAGAILGGLLVKAGKRLQWPTSEEAQAGIKDLSSQLKWRDNSKDTPSPPDREY